MSSKRRLSCHVHQGQSSTQKIRRNRNLRALPWSGLLNKTRPLQRSSTVPLGTRSCTARRPNVTYGQVSLSVASPRSAVLSRPCQHRQRLATLCNTAPVRSAPSPQDSAALVSTGNDWQHCATQPRSSLCPSSSRLSRPCQHHKRRGVPLPRRDCRRSSLQQQQY